MLSIRGLHAGYGVAPVLRGVDLEVPAGRITALLGRNGAGRSTLCKAVMGMIPATGDVRLGGHTIIGKASHQIARLGLGYVPETRDIFPGLTTRQNLLLGLRPGQRADDGQWPEARLYALFPNLVERGDVDAARLSGGEQQMLAIARTLIGAPKALIVDEPTEGLSPQITERLGAAFRRIAEAGTAVLLVEQKLTLAMSLAAQVAVMGQGRIQFHGTPQELLANSTVRDAWLKI